MSTEVERAKVMYKVIADQLSVPLARLDTVTIIRERSDKDGTNPLTSVERDFLNKAYTGLHDVEYWLSKLAGDGGLIYNDDNPPLVADPDKRCPAEFDDTYSCTMEVGHEPYAGIVNGHYDIMAGPFFLWPGDKEVKPL